MISVLGLPLERAKTLLERDNIAAVFLETRSKKGVEGGTEARVIRQTMRDESHAELVYAVFKTRPEEAQP